MSSKYDILAMCHDPAIIVDIESYRPEETEEVICELKKSQTIQEWYGPSWDRSGLTRFSNADELWAHRRCDLLIGRYSYPLIEVGCIMHPDTPVVGSPHWVGKEELLERHKNKLYTGCWTEQRITRLLPELTGEY